MIGVSFLAKLKIIGLGAGAFEHLSLGAWQALKKSPRIILRTEVHPVIDRLKQEEIDYSSFDYLYKKKDNFQEIYEEIVNILVNELNVHVDTEVVYAVPGHPYVAETSVSLIMERLKSTDIEIEVIPSMSFLDVMYAVIGIDPNKGINVLDALNLDAQKINPNVNAIITQVYNGFIASETKLTLLERYRAEHMVTVIRAAGVKGEEKIKTTTLWELDHIPWFDHLCSVFVPASGEFSCRYPLDPLINVMEKLLGPDGCPWDREQNHITLRPYLIEETYEVLEAIELQDMYKLSEELGDLLLQVVFHSALAQQRQDFTIEEVIQSISEKMIRRHPHVFGHIEVADSTEVLKNWEAIKKLEKGKESSKSLLDSIAKGLPSLMFAEEIQKKVAKVGFDWENWQDAWKKIEEELAELKSAYNSGRKDKIEDELGDVLFAVVNVARFFKVNPEVALLATINKFKRRFKYIEEKANDKNRNLSDLPLAKMDKWWEEAKNIEKEHKN